MIGLLANGHAALTLDRIKGALGQAACDAAVGASSGAPCRQNNAFFECGQGAALTPCGEPPAGNKEDDQGCLQDVLL
jgi:hypothetical protein